MKVAKNLVSTIETEIEIIEIHAILKSKWKFEILQTIEISIEVATHFSY